MAYLRAVLIAYVAFVRHVVGTMCIYTILIHFLPSKRLGLYFNLFDNNVFCVMFFVLCKKK